MKNAKDTFYIALRDRLQALNPQRSVILRGVQRPGILLQDAEDPMAQPLADVFNLQWAELKTDTQHPQHLAQMICEIRYATRGTEANAGLDRGRALSEMDAELLVILSPYAAQKTDYTTSPPTAMATWVFWSEPLFTPSSTSGNVLSRIARVAVFAFQEEGEL